MEVQKFRDPEEEASVLFREDTEIPVAEFKTRCQAAFGAEIRHILRLIKWVESAPGSGTATRAKYTDLLRVFCPIVPEDPSPPSRGYKISEIANVFESRWWKGQMKDEEFARACRERPKNIHVRISAGTPGAFVIGYCDNATSEPKLWKYPQISNFILAEGYEYRTISLLVESWARAVGVNIPRRKYNDREVGLLAPPNFSGSAPEKITRGGTADIRPETRIEMLVMPPPDSELPPDHLVDFNDLEFKVKVGEGAHGEVWSGKWRGYDVAIKVAKGSSLEIRNRKAEMFNEAARLANTRGHDNVIKLVGATRNGDAIYLVLELVKFRKGVQFADLQSLLGYGLINAIELKFDILLQIAQAMAHVHSKGVVHRDLSCRNVLLTQNFRVKICDFGLAAHYYSDGTLKDYKPQRLPTRWLAPESLLDDHVFNEKTDVWGFAALAWELITAAHPHAALDNDAVRARVRSKTLRLPWERLFISTAYPEVVTILNQCSSYDPDERPTFVKIAELLRDARDMARAKEDPDEPVQLDYSELGGG